MVLEKRRMFNIDEGEMIHFAPINIERYKPELSPSIISELNELNMAGEAIYDTVDAYWEWDEYEDDDIRVYKIEELYEDNAHMWISGMALEVIQKEYKRINKEYDEQQNAKDLLWI